jgi:hypothetical protein
MQTVLTVDNFPGHATTEEISTWREIPQWLKVEFLPENTTSIIQPQDGGIIARMKRYYRKALLSRLVAESEDPNLTVDGFKKKINVLVACQLVNDAWAAVASEEIAKVWDRTLLNKNTATITSEAMTRERRQELQTLHEEALAALVQLRRAAEGMGPDDAAARELVEVTETENLDDVLNAWFDIEEDEEKEEEQTEPSIDDVVKEIRIENGEEEERGG